MEKNKFDVPKKQWNIWTEIGRKMFNYVFSTMKSRQYLFTHPKAVSVPLNYWRTTCWNAAWIAADAVDELLDKRVTSTAVGININIDELVKSISKEVNKIAVHPSKRKR